MTSWPHRAARTLGPAAVHRTVRASGSPQVGLGVAPITRDLGQPARMAVNDEAPTELTAGLRRRRRRDKAMVMAAAQAGVLSRSQLYAAGFTRGEVRANIRAGRWIRMGAHCVRLGAGAMTQEARWWSAVLEGGPRAFLDGEAALVAAGLEHYETDHIRVSVPRGARIRHRGTTCNIRQTRRWRPDDVIDNRGVPRSRPAVAAIRAALWAKVAAAVRAGGDDDGPAGIDHRGRARRRDAPHPARPRRRFLHELLIDLAGGVRSLGELDVLRGCRERGIPEPDQQALRRTANGAYYLDFRWRAVARGSRGRRHPACLGGERRA